MHNKVFLHSIVEVPKEERIRCQAAGCRHSVYKAIHVVVADGAISLYGSQCFSKLFGGTAVATSGPSFGGSAGRLLSPEERAMLLENTERLIAMLEEEHRAEIDRLAALREQRHLALAWIDAEPDPEPEPKKQVRLSKEIQEQITAEAKRRFRKDTGLDPDAPGWVGLIWSREAEIRKELGYE